ncbi:carcinoembryonic antigen-related cell adhesion molecule 5-like [Hyla sarda]|uniref:carcinoembryonic antigen-related cell adhesion molecule 5-like n=1 Tax=Hyla sarda TaxID=327740 RepID=UPI0024C3AAEE|nr:carcinoembryonic antigen-related cell adhesion molecule 5-like [Hyla sarda]XP_056398455.1 carcinoembryonic antigen-related cell adhesion molecule 5-like [Hyla sarda]XP_056398457.1 carcinoembryonic antigen-related cell adhesion molecule 5-like [Hyla sarda]
MLHEKEVPYNKSTVLIKKSMSDISQNVCRTEMEHFLTSLSCVVVLLSLGGEAAVINVNGTLGKSVLFYVNYGVPANSLIQWNFFPPGGAAQLVAQYFSTYSCEETLKGRCEVFPNGSLRIDNVSYDDQGAYTLSTQIIGSAINNTRYQLRVYAPLTAPVLRTIVSKSPPTSGTNVTLQCDAAGNQNVTSYSFYRDQKAICSQPNVICSESVLNFTPIYVNDTGSYTCTIENPVSSNTSNSLTLIVIVPVSNITVTSNISGLVWPGIDSISLRCSALGTNVSYSWSLQGTTISTGTRFQLSANKSTLTISPVTTSDNGTFICTATNVINSLKSGEKKLNLASPVSAVTLISNTSADLWAGQDSVSLYCSAQGSAITFSWRLNGNPVSSSPPYNIIDSTQKSTLTISPVSKNDNGPFTCTASNRANNITSKGINLNINWFPDGDIQCTVGINQTIQLGCSWPGGKPAANVTLRFNGTENTGTDEVISSVTSSGNIHGSNLTCNGDQLGRTSNCTVAFVPPLSFPNTTIPPVTEGAAAIMTVNLTSGAQTRAGSSSSQVLPAQFSWFNGTDNSPIRTGGKFNVTSTSYVSTLKIDPASASDSGTYYCKATNIIGSTTYYFKVEVTKRDGGPSNGGLDGGQIAGIVIGVLAGVAIIGIIVFFVLKKRTTKETIYENTDSVPANLYENRLPSAIGTEMTRKEESNYEQLLVSPEKSIYHTVIAGSGK